MPIVVSSQFGSPYNVLISGQLGSPLGALGIFTLGVGDFAQNEAFVNQWREGSRATPRSFTKVAYNRFFTHKATPRNFYFYVDRLSRESLETAPNYFEIGSNEILKISFDFSNVLLAGESITNTPLWTVTLKRQNIVIPNVTSNSTFSGAVATIQLYGQRFIFDNTFIAMLGQANSELGWIRLGTVSPAGSMNVGLNLGGDYILECLVHLSSSRNETSVAEFVVPV